MQTLGILPTDLHSMGCHWENKGTTPSFAHNVSRLELLLACLSFSVSIWKSSSQNVVLKHEGVGRTSEKSKVPMLHEREYSGIA